MVSNLIALLVEFFNIPKKKAMLIVLIPYSISVASALIFGGVKVADFINKWDAAYNDIISIKKELSGLKQDQQTTAEESFFRDVLMRDYIMDLSITVEKSNNSMIEIYKETMKEPPNLPLIERIEKEVKDFQTKHLPHYKKDSIIWKIGVKPLNRMK